MQNTIKTTRPYLLQDLGMLNPTENATYKKRYGIYMCSCGNEFKADTAAVKSEKVSSCGCIRRNILIARNTKHGMSNNPLYGVWSDMIGRCTNIRCKAYLEYGARGISVCERWMNINNFIEDMYPSYKQGLSIDRIDNDKGYYLDNCRWTTKDVQGRNTRVLRSTNASGYRGVSWDKQKQKWLARININKPKHLGYFDTAIEAAKAYDRYVIENNLQHTINGVLNV